MSQTVGATPSDAEMAALAWFSEPLRPVPGSSSDAETQALASALREDHARGDQGNDALRRFVEAHSQSRWAPSIHLNLGSIAYHTGYFQRALAHWRAAWDLAKGGQDLASQQIANQALAEYAKMNARVGRTRELELVVAEAQGRSFMGDARVKMESALEGLWTMRNRPGVAFRCGPYALLSVAQELKPEALKKTTAFLDKVKSPPTGFSLSAVQAMSSDLGLELQMAKRTPGASVIVPSVVHWTVGHFGALVREENGELLLRDSTFGNETWLSHEALDQESSGYFLVPAGDLPVGWTRATNEQAAQIYGKGHSGSTDPDETGDGDHKTPSQCEGGAALAMATYQIHLLTASLHIEDTPVGYSAAVGPDVRVKVAYNQREASQPATINFTNFGPQFVSNWVSYLVDSPSHQAGNVALRKRGGGGEVHSNFDAQTKSYALQSKTASTLFRLSPDTYKKVYSDGSQEYYEQYIGTTGAQRKVFLTRVVDPQGNEVAIEYDDVYPSRIHRIVDATGLSTVFHYEYPGEPYLVTSIEDPYGREASFTYASVSGIVRLQSIQDPYGIVSSFEYDDAGEIVEMATPYGKTKFELSPLILNPAGYNLIRYIEATDPLGQKERVEYNTSTFQTNVPANLEEPHPSSSEVNFFVGDNDDRNSFYWNKLAMKLAPGDHLKAHRYHWVQPSTADVAMSILESEVPPLEGRIFYNYPGQTEPYIQGTLAFPSVVARVVEDAQKNHHTQATKYAYSALGNLTKVTDPIGRETQIEYGPNGIDVVEVKQRTGTSGGEAVWTTVASYTYGGGAPSHRPSSVTDGAGKTTQYTYASTTGQVLTITNAKGEVTTFTYETNPSSAAYGRLLSITGAVAGGDRSFTYDDYGHVRTTTDSEGYTLTYDYDVLDRVRTTTYPDGTFEQLEYEDHSLVASRDREGRWTRHMYNPLMERVLTQDAELRQTQFQWCRCGELRRFVDGNGNITEWQRDARSRVTKKVHPDGRFETYAYDYSGRLISEVDPMSRTVTYEYTVDDRLSKKDYSDAATADVLYTYDRYFPRVSTRRDGAGATSVTYHPYGTSTNGAGQVSLVNGPFSDDTQKYTYDELGRLKQLEIVDDATKLVASYAESYAYDARNRVSAVQNNLGSIAYSFVGQSSRPSAVMYANGMQSIYEYFDASGDFLLKQIKHLSAGPTGSVISQFDYTYRGDRSIATWAVDQGSGTKTWTFGYDGARELTAAELRDASGTVLESHAYGYDKAGNRIQVGAGTNAPKNYEVNSQNQLVSERGHGRTTFAGYVDEPATVRVNGRPAKMMSTDGGAPYRFEAQVELAAGPNTVVVEARDGNNNVSTQTYEVATTGTSKSYEYDANGNLRFEKAPNGTVLREYRWDQQNRLVRVLEGTHESVYEYDGASRRVRIKELTSGVETKNETFVWCGARICQKRAANGSTVVRSYFGNGFQESGPTNYFYTLEHLGSVREVVASDGTTVASRLSYDPWGKLTETGSGALSDFTYTGHYYDRPTGLSLAQYRGYDPNLGRWLSRDPTEFMGGLNFYAYVHNHPTKLVDPDGLWPREGFELRDQAKDHGYGPDEAQIEATVVGVGMGLEFIFGTTLYAATEGALVTVTSWAPAGTEATIASGRWVMLGSSTFRNWLLAGLLQLGYPIANSTTQQIQRSALQWPGGWEFIKGLFGQRICK